MKFLYNDGSGKIKEVSSKEELDYYIGISPDKNKIRIWLYHSSNWIGYQEYLKIVHRASSMPARAAQVVNPAPASAGAAVSSFPPASSPVPAPIVKEKKPPPETVTKPLQIILNICIVLVVAGGVYTALFYNKQEWTEPRVFGITAPRPANAAVMNMDSLIRMLEAKELRTLDNLTKLNLRLRNNWPDKIVLTLQAEARKHLKKDSLRQFNNLEWVVKNNSGYELDEAVVALNVWQDGEVNVQDTFRLTGIGYREPFTMNISNSYKGDSLTVHFYSIRSLGLNFCYTYEEPAISGNPNDKWFCKD